MMLVDKKQNVAQVAHDLKGPITSLKVIFQALAPEMREDVQDMFQRTIEQITYLSEEALTEERRQARRTNLYQEIAETLREQKFSHPELSYSISTKSKFLFANFDPREFQRVIENLIRNSIEAVGHNPETPPQVHIRLESTCGEVLISVRDNGPGIDSLIRKKVFRRGFTKNKATGTGIGLHYCKKVITKMGGKIYLNPVQAKGASILIRLPLGLAGSE